MSSRRLLTKGIWPLERKSSPSSVAVRVPEGPLGESMPEHNDQVNAAESSAQQRGTVENKAPKPAGLLPKNTQQLVILGVAVVMVLIMWLTGSGKRRATSSTAPPAGARIQPPNAATVEDFKPIQQEQAATRQPISPTNLARLQALGLAGDVPPGGAGVPPDGTMPQPGGIVGGG